MNCSEIQALLSAYFDGELAEDQSSLVSDHLDECSACAGEFAGFEKLSLMVDAADTPSPPEHLWNEIERQLDEQPVAKSVDRSHRRPLAAAKLFSLAAAVLIVAGAGWIGYHWWFAHHEDHQFAAVFGEYLDEFRRDPMAAQDLLLAKYDSLAVDAKQAVRTVGYRPAVADGMPAGYSLDSTHVMKMPCCTCVQTVCRRNDGSTIAIFEHDEDEPDWFGDRPKQDAMCSGVRCCLVDLDDQLAASWQRGGRHMTVIGAHDAEEVDRLVAWFHERRAGESG